MGKKIFLKIVAVMVVCALLFSVQTGVFAENDSVDNKAEEKTEEKAPDEISARSPHVILIDMRTGSSLYSRKAKEKVYPASLTKIMTAMLVLENCNLEDVVAAKETAISNVQDGSSKLGIKKDERLSVRQLTYAMMLTSAADAANVLAEHASGSIEKFVDAMNKKAKSLGMKNTNFTNPVGDHDERHYTTAQDMARLCVYAMQNESLREIVKSSSYSIPATEKNDKERRLINKNYLISTSIRNDYYYKYATGLKTGYTKEAKSCIAATAEKNGMQLLALVFEAESEDGSVQSFVDCINMFNFVFDNYSARRVVKQDAIVSQTKVLYTRRTKKVILQTEAGIDALRDKKEEDIKITFKDDIPESVKAPIKKGQVIGKREYFVNGASVGTINLIADKEYRFDPITFVVSKTIDFFTSPWLFVVIALVIVILILLERRRRRILRKKRRMERNKRNQELMKSVYEK